MTLTLGQRWLTGSVVTVPDGAAESKGFVRFEGENPLTSTLSGGRGTFRSGLPRDARQDSWMVTDVIATGSSGRSREFRGAETILSTTSMPRVTTPNKV